MKSIISASIQLTNDEILALSNALKKLHKSKGHQILTPYGKKENKKYMKGGYEYANITLETETFKFTFWNIQS